MAFRFHFHYFSSIFATFSSSIISPPLPLIFASFAADVSPIFDAFATCWAYFRHYYADDALMPTFSSFFFAIFFLFFHFASDIISLLFSLIIIIFAVIYFASMLIFFRFRWFLSSFAFDAMLPATPLRCWLLSIFSDCCCCFLSSLLLLIDAD